MVAVLQAAGVYQRKSWPDALNTLALAAALGWEAAREQLVLLAQAGDRPADASLADHGDSEFWRSYPARIDLGRWLSAPAGRVLHEDPLVKSIPDLLPEPLCRLLIRLSASRLNPALVYDAVDKRNYRSSNEFDRAVQSSGKRAGALPRAGTHERRLRSPDRAHGGHRHSQLPAG